MKSFIKSVALIASALAMMVSEKRIKIIIIGWCISLK